MNSNCSLLVLLVIILIIIIVSTKSNRKNNKKNKSNKDFHQQLETFVSQLESGNVVSINNKQSKVAIVSMVTKQPDFAFWLYYHLDHLKLDLIILRVEDSPEYKPLIEKYGNRVIATYYNKDDIDMKHNYLTIMDRQKENVNSGIQKAKELGIDYIFHTDADELIYVAQDNQKTPISNLLRQYLDDVHSDYDCIHFKNFEAVFPNKEKKCFNTNRFIDCKKGQCLSYANGKSAGKVQNGIKFHGPHYFSGNVYDMPDNKMAVLHFDSCTYTQWETKFDLLKDTNEEKMKKIPFPFYKNSIKKLQKCGGDKKKETKCQKELIKYYEEQKILPYETKNTREMNFY